MKTVLALTAVLVLVGCGESDEAIYKRAYKRAYEQGYNDGQYDVCRELGNIASGLKDRLRHCRGY